MNNLSAFDVGFIMGIGCATVKTASNQVIIPVISIEDGVSIVSGVTHSKSIEQEIVRLLELSGSCELYNSEYLIRCSADYFADEINKYTSETALTDELRKFIIGYVTSNATIVNGGDIELTFHHKDNIFPLFNLIAAPSASSFNSNTFMATALYTGVNALDLLNCYSVVPSKEVFILPRTDLEELRIVYLTNLQHRGSLADVGIDYSEQLFGNINSYSNVFRYAKLLDNAVPPTKVRASDVGYDLTLIRKVKTVVDVEFYGTGIAVAPPEGYYFQLVPRSSISKTNYSLANNVGIIDPTYRGEIIVALRRHSSSQDADSGVTSSSLELPSRIVQIIPTKLHHFDAILVPSLSATSRDIGGFGSTGK